MKLSKTTQHHRVSPVLKKKNLNITVTIAISTDAVFLLTRYCSIAGEKNRVYVHCIHIYNMYLPEIDQKLQISEDLAKL